MKRTAPAADRNKAPILAVLRRLLPARARVLEIGSGTGQHAAHFTGSEPGWIWQPTDASEAAVESVEAYRAESASPGFLPPLRLDVRDAGAWPPGPYDALFSANVIHISPWPVCPAIVAGAARVLEPGGLLILYGPFRFSGEHVSESNVAFDRRLRGEDPEWGVRDVADIQAEAARLGFAEPELIALPANNHILVFRRSA